MTVTTSSWLCCLFCLVVMASISSALDCSPKRYSVFPHSKDVEFEAILGEADEEEDEHELSKGKWYKDLSTSLANLRPTDPDCVNVNQFVEVNDTFFQGTKLFFLDPSVADTGVYCFQLPNNKTVAAFLLVTEPDDKYTIPMALMLSLTGCWLATLIIVKAISQRRTTKVPVAGRASSISMRPVVGRRTTIVVMPQNAHRESIDDSSDSDDAQSPKNAGSLTTPSHSHPASMAAVMERHSAHVLTGKHDVAGQLAFVS